MKHTITVFTFALFLLAGCGDGHSHDHANCAGHHSHAHKHANGATDHGHAHKHADCAGHHGHAHKHTDCAGHHDHAHKLTACATQHGHGHGHAAPRAVTVTKAIQSVAGIKTVRSEKRRIASTLSLAGRWELSPDARLTVASPVAGRLAILVKPLARVRKGDVLFTVTSPDLVSRARTIAVLEKRLAVYREIKTPNAALENELAVKRAERTALLAGAEEKDGVVTVRAETDGLVESYAAQNGAWLETGAPALVTVRPQALRFTALAAASDARKLTEGQRARVGAEEGVLRLGVGDDTGLVPVYVVFRKDVAALAGERARATCVTDEAETPRPSVPSAAIVSIGLQPTVFVKDAHDAEKFIAVSVTPGASGGGWTAVEGLPSADAEVVTDGAYELKLALPSADKKPAGHFHADGTFHEGEH